MIDRELLEFAAKAHGGRLAWCADSQSFAQEVPFRQYFNYEEWNPLTSNGDALELMMKCGITAYVSRDFQAEATDEHERACCIEPCQNGTDEEAMRCLRRVITRAAADIARAME